MNKNIISHTFKQISSISAFLRDFYEKNACAVVSNVVYWKKEKIQNCLTNFMKFSLKSVFLNLCELFLGWLEEAGVYF